MEEFKGDKRTKAYKDWKANFEQTQADKPQGLGDTIEKITEITGIKKAVKFLAGEDCNCDARREKLNKVFRYNNPECLTEDEYNFLMDCVNTIRDSVSSAQQIKILRIYNRVFHANKQPTSCSRCFAAVWQDLKTLLNEYH